MLRAAFRETEVHVRDLADGIVAEVLQQWVSGNRL